MTKEIKTLKKKALIASLIVRASEVMQKDVYLAKSLLLGALRELNKL